jgi:hypothetical protein
MNVDVRDVSRHPELALRKPVQGTGVDLVDGKLEVVALHVIAVLTPED